MSRTPNLTERQSCDWCRDTGYVTVEGPDGKGYDTIVAPCPYCEAGYREEFPDPGNNTTPIRPPWNPEIGYWHNRDRSILLRERAGHEIHLSPEEQRQHLRAMGKALGLITRTVDQEIEPAP